MAATACGCGSSSPPPAIPPTPALMAPPALWPPDPRLAPADHRHPGPTRAPAGQIGSSAPPPAEPTPSVVIERPYKLGERPEPTTAAEYKRDILERRHWNTGGLGELIGDPPPVEGHPDPRVIVNVVKVQGPQDPSEVQRIARQYHWINVVRCYRLGAYKDPELRGWTKAQLDVARAGRVVSPRLLETELGDAAVAECMVDKLRSLQLPRAARGARVWLELRVAPGDEPLPPPEELIVAGDGQLGAERMEAGVRAGLGAIERCYRAAFAYAPGLWGRLLIRFHLQGDGTLDEAFEAGSRFPDARVRQCVLRVARRLAFDPPTGGELRFVVPVRLFSDVSAHERAAPPPDALPDPPPEP